METEGKLVNLTSNIHEKLLANMVPVLSHVRLFVSLHGL